MNMQFNLSSPRQQNGAVLVVSLLLLLVVTILALGAGQSSRMQERMASSQRNYDLALQAAEAGLRAGERMVGDNTISTAPLPCQTKQPPLCWVFEAGYLNGVSSYENQAFESDAWWSERAFSYASDGTVIAGEGMSRSDPEFYIEEVEEVADSLSIPPTGPPPSRIYYRVVSRGKGGTANASVVLHSTYVRRFN